MEFKFTCNVCSHHESWTTEQAAQAAASWHVYSDHPQTWLREIGDRPPRDPRPETLGRQFEPWESQA